MYKRRNSQRSQRTQRYTKKRSITQSKYATQSKRINDASIKLRRKITNINRETNINSINVNLMTRCSSYATRIISIMGNKFVLTCSDNPLIICKSIINQMYRSITINKEFYKQVSLYFKNLFNGYTKSATIISLLFQSIDIERIHVLPIEGISQTFIAYNVYSDNLLTIFNSSLKEKITIMVLLSSYVEDFGFQVEHAYNIVICGDHVFITSSWGTSRHAQ